MDPSRPPAIRQERSDDHDAVDGLLRAAFVDDDVPARLASLLRERGLHEPELTFVADDEGRIVGHVMLSRLAVARDGDAGLEALNLTPLAVAPDAQGRGIGRRLVEHAVRMAATTTYPLVILEGDPRHYHRYGFRTASAAGLTRPSERIPDEAFMFLPLPAYDPVVHRGAVAYPAPFHELDAFGP
jgi:putative acetyltransferase